MKKKSSPKTTPLEALRKNSAYSGHRFFFAMPFYVMAAAQFLSGCAWIVTVLQSESLMDVLALWGGLVTMLGIMFTLSIPAALGALFDIADAALRAESREAEKAAKAAYDDFKRNQGV